MDKEKLFSSLQRAAEKAQRIRRPQTREAKIIFSLIYLFFNLLIISVISLIQQSVSVFIFLFVGLAVTYYFFRYVAAFLSTLLWCYIAYEILWNAQSEAFIQSLLLTGLMFVAIVLISLIVNLLLVTLGLRKRKKSKRTIQ